VTENDRDLTEQAKQVTTDFVNMLGLQELIFGGISLYLFWLRNPSAAASQFPSTGASYLDVPLLACAAAFVGKLLSFVIAVVMAIVAKSFRHRWAYCDLDIELIEYRKKLGNAKALDAHDHTDLALAYVVRAWPERQAYFERIKAKSSFAYGCVILAVLAIWSTKVGSDFRGWFIAAASGFLVLGILQQFDYVRDLQRNLISIRETPPPAPQGS
jgi:hypothetical protein